jgi:starch-binding outer membrane protein, SusD/RagB family
MKKINQRKIINYLILLLILIPKTSCDDFLDRQPLNQYGEEAVWSDAAMMEHFVNNIYYNISHSLDRPMLGALTDEALMDPGSDYGQVNTMKSLITPSDLITFDRGFTTRKLRWEDCYSNIRACNLFLEQIENYSYDDEETVIRLTGEIHFLRGYYYHNLVFLYGGVPIITNAYDLSDDFSAERNTFEESVNFIVSELDKAAELLPLYQTGSDHGRATKGAALSLKARVLLYAASDLYNCNASWADGYAHPELVGFVGGDRTARWKAAKNAAKAVIDLGIYSLYKEDPAPDDSVAQNYNEVFIEKETSEQIFVRNFIATNQSWTYNIGIQNLPVGYHGWGNIHVASGMVDDYEMSNGDKFDWDNPEHRENPYKNRDQRLYSDIFFNGANWRQRPDDVVALDPDGIIQTGRYEQEDGSWVDGLDAKNSPVSTWTGTYTGYYLRKFQDITIDAPKEISPVPWQFIRYGEILLSYAEACVELGEDNEANKYLNMIRKRAGLPDINKSADELRESIRHERKIELMFEDKRFFDIRRWMIAPEVTSDVYGVDIRYALNEDKPTHDLIKVSEREWKDRFYFLPIKIEEMNRNELLIQNPLY